MANITFYGTRGSFPLSGEKYIEYGGATTCVLMRFNSATIMVDSGSGAIIASEELKDVSELHLFISHFHSDHISGLVALIPAFINKKLHIYSKSFNGLTTKENIERFMSDPLWPVPVSRFDNVIFHELEDETIINDVKITYMDSNHPGGSTIFRLKDKDSDIVTAFDFSHTDGYDEKLLKFAYGCKTLIYDGYMTQEEQAKNPTWGHSTPEMGALIGKKLGVENLYITHFGYKDDDTLSKWENSLGVKYPFLKFAKSGMRKNDLLKMVEIGTLLTQEKDHDKLLRQIVEATMDITSADGGTLYLLKNNQLEFKVLITKSKGLVEIQKENELSLPPVDINAKNICAASARDKKVINVENCYLNDEYDFSGVKKYDELNNYQTKSVLVIPMTNSSDEVIGVLQLINAMDGLGKIIPFVKQDERIIRAIANEAAVSLENVAYSNQIFNLLYGFVKVMSVGIDERTPYNAHHTKNMVNFAEKFFDYEELHDGPYKVSKEKRHEILMSIWLHDVGKILTPLDIMNKDSRLGEDLVKVVENRFDRRDLLLQLSHAKRELSDEEYNTLETNRLYEYDLIFNKINRVGFLNDDLKNELDKLKDSTYKELDGSITKVITEDEYIELSTIKGTLSKEERGIMENHVSLTQKLLAPLDFPKNYENIPLYAGSHHEFLNGSGYPNHLTDKDLPWPCRLITVFDIFEALTAHDRPYKKQIPVDKSLAILRDMAKEGKLDNDVIDEFEKVKVWE